MNGQQVTPKDIRSLAIDAQGLSACDQDNLSIIQQLSYVQIDTISVTERAHHHVFHTRNNDYKKEDLTQMMEDKSIFEYWSHAAAYLPIEDFRFSLIKKEQYRKGGKHWFPRDKKIEQYVLDRIKAEGPLQSKDFENQKDKNHQWYEWKPAKIALTNLFMDGTLMIKNRIGFQKVFDFTENVIPNDVNSQLPTEEEYCEYLIKSTINAHGIASLTEMVYLRKGIKPTAKNTINRLIENKELVVLQLPDSKEYYYSTPKMLDCLSKQIINEHLHILSPFDNLVIQRKRLKTLFDFDYQIECYVTEAKRIYGYYVLPVLYGNKFVARIDAKANRKEDVFVLINCWFEKEFKPSDEFYRHFFSKLNSYAAFCGCSQIQILTNSKTNKELKKAFKGYP